jgi:hypothetical protein
MSVAADGVSTGAAIGAEGDTGFAVVGSGGAIVGPGAGCCCGADVTSSDDDILTNKMRTCFSLR